MADGPLNVGDAVPDPEPATGSNASPNVTVQATLTDRESYPRYPGNGNKRSWYGLVIRTGSFPPPQIAGGGLQTYESPPTIDVAVQQSSDSIAP